MNDRNMILSHTEAETLLAAYTANELQAAERLQMEQHLAQCEECQHALMEIKHIRELLKTLNLAAATHQPDTGVEATPTLPTESPFADMVLAKLERQEGRLFTPVKFASDKKENNYTATLAQEKNSAIGRSNTRFSQPTSTRKKQEKSNTMHSIHLNFREGRTWIQRASTIAAVLFTALLVGSLIFLFDQAHQNRSGGPGFTINHQTITSRTGVWYSIRMVDATTGWALTNKAILRTSDGGIHWKDVSPPKNHFITQPTGSPPIKMDTWGRTAVFLNASTAWVVAPQIDQASTLVFRTADGGQTWQEASIKSWWTKQITAINAQDSWITSVPDAGTPNVVELLRTTNGGKSWFKIASTTATAQDTASGLLPPGTDISGVSFLNASVGWATGSSNTADFAWFYMTTDGGSTWQHQTLSLPTNVTATQLVISPPTFFTSNDGILPVSFFNGSDYQADIYRTQDGGRTWESTIPIPVTYGGDTRFLDMNHWLLPNDSADGTIIYMTRDGGQSWSKIEPKAAFKDIQSINLVSNNTGWAIGDNLPASSPALNDRDNITFLLKTTDGGYTWEKVPYTIV